MTREINNTTKSILYDSVRNHAQGYIKKTYPTFVFTYYMVGMRILIFRTEYVIMYLDNEY